MLADLLVKRHERHLGSEENVHKRTDTVEIYTASVWLVREHLRGCVPWRADAESSLRVRCLELLGAAKVCDFDLGGSSEVSHEDVLDFDVFVDYPSLVHRFDASCHLADDMLAEVLIERLTRLSTEVVKKVARGDELRHDIVGVRRLKRLDDLEHVGALICRDLFQDLDLRELLPVLHECLLDLLLLNELDGNLDLG